MNKEWVGCAQQNFKTGRNGFRPEAIVIHIICGSLDSARAHFADPSSVVSAHYGVGRDGRVVQFVEEENTAFHAGIVVSPVWPQLRKGVNPNFYTIGIEHEGQPADVWTEEEYAASAALVAEAAQRWDIPIDENHIVMHREIRASKTCPGATFKRDELVKRAKEIVQSGSITRVHFEVELVGNVNVRQKPARTSPVARVLPAGDSIVVAGYTTAGETVQGNSSWYLTPEGNYVWAGATTRPNPQHSQPAPLVAETITVTPPAGPVRSGIVRIDDLLKDGAQPLTTQDADPESVGAIQDLLSGHAFRGLPSILSPLYGKFGPKTQQAVHDFQKKQNIAQSGAVDKQTLGVLIKAQPTDPRISRAYMTLVLGLEYRGLERILSLVAQMEGLGKFGSLNLNTDRAGLSFGIIQWAQRPGRLRDILDAFAKVDPAKYVATFGDNQEELANSLLAHVRRPNGGVDKKTGITIDPTYDLTSDAWVRRFSTAALDPQYQRIQINVALAAFRQSFRSVRQYAPELDSERAVAFMLDVANQCGDGGLRSMYRTVKRDGMAEADVLQAIADETIDLVAPNLQAGVRSRRDSFLYTPHLSDATFAE